MYENSEMEDWPRNFDQNFRKRPVKIRNKIKILAKKTILRNKIKIVGQKTKMRPTFRNIVDDKNFGLNFSKYFKLKSEFFSAYLSTCVGGGLATWGADGYPRVKSRYTFDAQKN